MSIRQTSASQWLGRLGVLAAVVAVLVALAVAAAPVDAQAPSRSASASLSGDAEVPSLDSTGSGSFTGTFSGGQLTFNLTATVAGITQAHIHLGAADENGGVVAFLFGPVDPGVGEINVSGTITEADLIGAVEGDFQAFAMALEAGNGYVNVHTEANPPGEVRGQISLGPLPTVTALPATGSGGLADAGGGLAPIAAGALAGGLVLLLGLGVRGAAGRRA